MKDLKAEAHARSIAAACRRRLLTHTTIKTKTSYYGIHIQEKGGDYWIVDDNGNEEFMGSTPPTQKQIDSYAIIARGGR